MQEVKDYMGYNGDVKFLVSNELSKSEEFGNFIATCNKKNVLEASLLRNDCDTKEDATSPSAGARAKMCWSCHDTIGGPTGLSKCRGCRSRGTATWSARRSTGNDTRQLHLQLQI